MKIDLEKLLRSLKLPTNHAKNVLGKRGKPVSRQYISQLIEEGKIVGIKIDNIEFAVTDPDIANQVKKFQEKQEKKRIKKLKKKDK
jgi:hypothetical protein